MSDSLIVRDFSVRLRTEVGAVTPVQNVSLDLRPGQRVAIVGESGCGKSMLLRGLLRLLPPTVLDGLEGSAKLGDISLPDLTEKQWRTVRGQRISIVFQDAMSRLNPTMPIGKQIGEALPAHRLKGTTERVAQLLGAVGLDGSVTMQRRYPHELSGGMCQRVLIAIALAAQPEILIADEPTTALDVTVQAQILRTIDQLVTDRGMSLLVVTHDLGVVSGLCDYVYVMYAGQVVEEGSVDDVFGNPQHPYTRGLLDCVLEIGEQRQGRVPTIPGVVPAPGAITSGCRFRARCPIAQTQCEIDPPFEATAGTTARCWFPGGGGAVIETGSISGSGR